MGKFYNVHSIPEKMYRHYIVIRQNTAYPPYPDKPWLMDLNSHALIIGKTGSGKSNYLLQILKHLDREDCNIVLIDPHGLTADSFLSATEKDTILLSGHDYPGSEGKYSGINVLHTSGKEESAYLTGDWLRQAFSKDDALSGGTWGPRLNLVFSQVMVNLMMREKGLTLEKFADIITDPKRLLSYFPVQEHSPIRNQLVSFSGNARIWGDFIMSSVNKIFPLVGNPLIRRVISAADDESVDLDGIIQSGNHLIVPELNIGEIGINSARVIASLLLAQIWNILLMRGPSDYRTYIVIDEAREMPLSILELLISQGRKYGVVLILATQTLKRDNGESFNALFPNLHNYACFNLSEEDAEKVAANISGAQHRNQLITTLVEQDRHDVTVACNYVRTAGDGTGNDSAKYGPVTLRPLLFEQIHKKTEIEKIKSEIINRIGYMEQAKKLPHEETTLHNRMIYLFADFLEGRGVRRMIEPNIGGLVPDILIEYKGKPIFCEVEDSDLLVTHRIAKKMKDYMGKPIIFLCRDEDFGKLAYIFQTIVNNAGKDGFYQVGEEQIPFSRLPKAVLNTYIVTYADGQFYFFNGTRRVKFSLVHLEKDPSFMARAKKLSSGQFRAELFPVIVEMITDKGGIDLDEIESKYGRDRLRELLQKIQESRYSEGLTLNSLLELDRIGGEEAAGSDSPEE